MRRTPQSRRVAAKDRIRVARACTACRGRKVRCVPREVGDCRNCEANGRTCVFEEIQETSRSSTRTPGSNASHGESTQDREITSFKNDAGVRVLGDFAGSPVNSCFGAGNTGSHSQTPDCDPGTTPDVSLSSELEGAVLLVEEPGRTQYTGLRSNESFLLCVREVLDAEKGTRAHNNDSIEPKKTDGTISPPHPCQSKEVIQALHEFPPQPIANFLVSTFFYYVEATFCYCDREWFIQALNSVYAGTASPSMADDAFVCFALLVFAFGSQFAHLRSRTDTQEPLAAICDPGKRFYDISQSLIPRVIAKCTLKGIQVCLLVGLYNLPSNLPDASYLYLGIAMRMAIASGLHRVTTAARLDERLVEVRNRLWWSLYCIDRRTSIALGRPASISESDIDAPYPKYHHSLDELEYRSNFQHQIEYIKLTKIVNMIMRDIPLELKPKSIFDLSSRLKEWRSKLFSNLHPNDLLPGERNFRTTIHLQVHYHWAWIRMGRASLLQLLRERLQAASSLSKAPDQQPQSRQELTNFCVDAAKATIQLILVLKQHNLLCRFSFTDHQPTTAALIILVLDSILQQCDDAGGIVRDGVEMLKFMAHGGCRGAKSDLQTVEQLRAFAVTLRQRINEVESSTQTHTAEDHTVASNTVPDAYQSWVRWMSEKESNGATNLLENHPEAQSGYEEPVSGLGANDIGFSNQSPFDLEYLDREMGYGDGNFGFEWDYGRIDMLDVSQLLAGQNYLPEGDRDIG